MPRRGLNGKMWIFEKPTSRDGVDRLGELGVGLAGEADDDVGRDRRPVEPLLHQPAAVDEPPAAPAAAHAAQHAVAAALHRDVQVRATLSRMVGHHVDQLARDLGGFDAREPHAEVAGQLGNLPHQVREATSSLRPSAQLAVPLDAVVAQVDAGEHDLAIAAVDEPADFVEDVRHRPAGSCGRTCGMMQKLHRSMQPSCTLT